MNWIALLNVPRLRATTWLCMKARGKEKGGNKEAAEYRVIELKINL